MRIIGEFVHTRTGEIYVPYVGLYQMSAMLVRPRANFLEAVDRPDYAYRGPRFAFIRPC